MKSKIKIFFIVLISFGILLIGAISSKSGTMSYLVKAEETQKDVLFIGNSMTYYNTLCNVVQGIATHKGHNIKCSAATNGGKNLIYNAKADNVVNAIKKGGYEVVVLQDIVGSFDSDRLMEGARDIISVIKKYNPNAQIIFYEPWPTKDTITGTSGLLPYFTYSYIQTAKSAGASLAPAGEAFYELYTQHDKDYYCGDNKHPQVLGTFTSASAVYHAMYPDGLKPVQGEIVNADVFTKANGNMAVGCQAYASNEKQSASYAVDGNTGSRWETESADPQWLYVDLGEKKDINKVGFIWEGAYAAKYYIQISDNANEWKTVAVVNATSEKTVQIDLGTTYNTRYVRMYGTKRGTGYGYSFYEMGVWNDSEPDPTKPEIIENGSQSYAVAEFNAKYKVRAYALMEDGTYYYSKISSYRVFDVAKVLYDEGIMNTFSGHEYLYNNILKVVDATYKEVDYNWNNAIINPDRIQ